MGIGLLEHFVPLHVALRPCTVIFLYCGGYDFFVAAEISGYVAWAFVSASGRSGGVYSSSARPSLRFSIHLPRPISAATCCKLLFYCVLVQWSVWQWVVCFEIWTKTNISCTARRRHKSIRARIHAKLKDRDGYFVCTRWYLQRLKSVACRVAQPVSSLRVGARMCCLLSSYWSLPVV